MRVAYLRVSSKDQHLDRQKELLKDKKIEKWFEEKQSGKNIEDRSELQKMLNFIRQDDIVFIASLDRLSRSSEDLTDIMQDIKSKGATLQSLDLPDFSNVPDPNLRNMLNDVLISVFKYTAQNERERIRERQKQGIAVAKQKGIYTGKKVMYGPDASDPKNRAVFENIITKLQNGLPKSRIARETGVDVKTVRRIAQRQIKTPL